MITLTMTESQVFIEGHPFGHITEEGSLAGGLELLDPLFVAKKLVIFARASHRAGRILPTGAKEFLRGFKCCPGCEAVVAKESICCPTCRKIFEDNALAAMNEYRGELDALGITRRAA